MKTILLLLILPLSIINAKTIKNNNNIPVTKWTGARRVLESAGVSPAISIADSRIVEGNSGHGVVEAMVTLSQVMTAPFSVNYRTKNVTAIAGEDYEAAKGSIIFAPGEMMKRIKVSVIGEVLCEEDETFQIILGNSSDASIDAGAGMVTIVNDDCRGNNKSGTPASGSGGAVNISGNLSVYEVRLTHTGYTSFTTGPSECGIRSNGRVVLTGLLSGSEKVAEDDDITYRGTLQMDMDIDICSVMRKPNGEDALCGMTVIGSGPVKAELEIYFDSRGGYIKIEHTSGQFLKNVYGSCDHAQISEEQTMVPNKTIASIFNGRELPMLTDRTLRVGRLVETDGENETVVEVLRILSQ
jgi:Calx-beta domain.